MDKISYKIIIVHSNYIKIHRKFSPKAFKKSVTLQNWAPSMFYIVFLKDTLKLKKIRYILTFLPHDLILRVWHKTGLTILFIFFLKISQWKILAFLFRTHIFIVFKHSIVYDKVHKKRFKFYNAIMYCKI